MFSNIYYDFFTSSNSFVYLILIKYLKIFKLKIEHYILFLLGYITYFIYYSQLEEFDNRYDVISSEIDRAINTIFTNTLAGLISLFMSALGAYFS